MNIRQFYFLIYSLYFVPAISVYGDEISYRVHSRSDGYQVALWKLFHHYNELDGLPWAQIIAAHPEATRNLVSSYETQGGFDIREYLISDGSLQALPQFHQVRLEWRIDQKTKLLVKVEPTIVFMFRGGSSISELRRMFHGRDLVSRLIRLRSFRSAANEADGVKSIQVTFRDLRNMNFDWGCNGFIVEAELARRKAPSKALTYFVGSGLDPFSNRLGAPRREMFVSKDILVDPEYGPACEQEDAGECVFLKQ